MSLDHLLFTDLEAQVSTPSVGLVRGVDSDDLSVEPPRIEYLPTSFTPQNIDASTLVYENVPVRIRVRSVRDIAYNESDIGQLDTLCAGVISDLSGHTPTIAGYQITRPLELPAEPSAQLSGNNLVRDLVFFLSMTKGFSVAPIYGGEGSASIAGYSGTAKQYQLEARTTVDYAFTDDTDTVEQAELGYTRVSGTIDFYPPSNNAPVPVSSSTVSASFALNSSFAWTESIKINGVRMINNLDDPERPLLVRVSFVIDNASSPMITGGLS